MSWPGYDSESQSWVSAPQLAREEVPFQWGSIHSHGEQALLRPGICGCGTVRRLRILELNVEKVLQARCLPWVLTHVPQDIRAKDFQ